MIRIHSVLYCASTLCIFVACVFASRVSAEEIVRFNRDIRPIFSKTCFACHGPDANAREAGLRLDVRDAAVMERDGFQPIIPGDAESSAVFQRMIAKDPFDRMPPADFHTQLTDKEKQLVRRWINQGAEYESHWSFIPPQRTNVPDGSNAIDHFVALGLVSNGLTAANPADRATLIRRVSLDLTGLPPTPQEVRAFVSDSDTDDDAFGKVVDRMLNSAAYAEHRTRYWLDAARYADTSGYQYDRIREQWVWRDWVIAAFDTNMPFDEFTIAQMAGDLLPEASPQTRLATGFHRNHPITIEGGVIDEEYRTEYVMDRVVTSSTTWLGLTFLCARCHDHKYDPISQEDFYSLYAFFNRVPERGLNGFNPKEKIPSPLQPNRFSELEARAAEIEGQIEKGLQSLRHRFASWESQLKETLDSERTTVRIESLNAESGTQLVPQDDSSILATGPNPATQTYTIEFTTAETPVRAVRLEAMTDPSHVGQSTGRGHNGNFVLSEVQIEAAQEDGVFKAVQIVDAEANYEQKGYPVKAAIDGKTGRGGWAVDGNSRFADSEAVFTLGQTLPPESKVRVKLVHTWGGSHTIGRFRLTVPANGQAPIPRSVRKVLAIDPADRTDEAQAEFTRFVATRFGPESFLRLMSQQSKIQSELKRVSGAVPETMVMAEMPSPRPTYVLMRGEYDKPITEREVQPDIPKVFGNLPSDLPKNRLGLAQWMVSRDNPLTARVTVNRFWAQLFGVGLVKTIEDFGSQGEYPSHPDLLDWLAVEFMESGWNVKHLLRTIVMSHTYRQSSHVTSAIHARDPENRLLARGPRHRLDAETIRDSALAVSGLLDSEIGGPSVYPYHPQGLWLEINNRPGYSRAYPHTREATALYRRSMYTFWKRTVPPPSMAAFDAPEREFCLVQRSRTNTPLQAFVLLHDPQFVEAARRLGQRMITEGGTNVERRLRFGFELCLGRSPQPEELSLLEESLETRSNFFQDNPQEAERLLAVGESPVAESLDQTELAAYATVARILLNLSEFITKG
ncbi:MAG: PSD1 and planctomycete cytochrome C domain-containing protein [Planctomycetota bacterium]